MTDHVYGYCPMCGAAGEYRERRMDGNDVCERGHTYPSRTSLSQKPESISDVVNAYRAAVEYALDPKTDEPIVFLRYWNEGDWQAIAEDWKDFDLKTIGEVEYAKFLKNL